MSKGSAFGMADHCWSVGTKRAGNPDIEDYGKMNNVKVERKANQGEGKPPAGKLPNMKDCKY